MRTMLLAACLGAASPAAAGLIFPQPDAEGCFAIAPDFDFCGADLGWRGNASSHPYITAIFTGTSEGDWLVLKLFDPETGTMGAMAGTSSEEAAEFLEQRRQASGLEAEVAVARGVGGKVVRDMTDAVSGYAVRSVVVAYSKDETHGGTRVISEFTGEPWVLTLSTSSAGGLDQAWQQHLDALAALRIDK